MKRISKSCIGLCLLRSNLSLSMLHSRESGKELTLTIIKHHIYEKQEVFMPENECLRK